MENKNHKSESGQGAVEILLVLVLAIVVIGALIVILAPVFEGLEINQAIQTLDALGK